MKKLSFLILFMTSLLFSYDATTGAINNIGGSCYQNNSCNTDVHYGSCEDAFGVANYTGPIIGGGIVSYCTPAPSEMGGVGSITDCYISSVTCPPPSDEQPTDVMSTDLLPSGTTKVKFRDDAIMLLFPDGSAITFDANGQSIPNRSNGGTTPPLSDFDDTNAFTPNSNKVYSDISINGDSIFVITDGKVGFHSLSNLNGLNVLGSVNINITPVMTNSNNEKISKSPAPTSANPDAVSVDLTKINFDNVDFSQYENSTSTPTPVGTTGLVSEKIDSTNQAKIPAIKTDTVIFHYPDDYSKFISSTPTTLSIGEQLANGSITQATFQKLDITNTMTNNTDLPYTVQTTTPPTIQSDGTTTQTTTTISQGSTNPTTGTTTTTNSSTGTTTTTTNSITGTSTTAGTTSPSGTGTIDLSGVTSRLDKISNQITKVNDFNEKIDKSIVSDVQHGIPATPSSWDSWTTTFDNMKSDLSNVAIQANDLQSFINGSPLTLNLTGGSVTTCPYIKTLDIGVKTFDVTLDLCKTLSPARNIVYMLVYFPLVISILMFAIKILFLMAV